jgi:hypothetical protein
MKHFKPIIVALLLATTSVNAQAQNEDEQYEMTRTYASINTSLYVKAMNLMFRLDTLSADDVLVTRIDGNKTKNKYVTRSEIRTYLCKQYLKSDQKRFKLTAETNNGYVLVIGQYGKDPDVAIRFFTLFIDQLSGKINVIEIEENE